MPNPADPFDGFSLDQARRVAALNAARDVLAPATLGGPTPDAIDVYNLAVFIEHGSDPWAIGPVRTAPGFGDAEGGE